MFLSKRERPTGGKQCTWTRPFARPRPSSTSDEGDSAVPNSRLITAVIWISKHCRRRQRCRVGALLGGAWCVAAGAPRGGSGGGA